MRCRAKWMHPMRHKMCLLNRSQVGQILIVGGKLPLINLTQGSFTNDTLISRNFSTCISRSKKIAIASSMVAPIGPGEDAPTPRYSHGHQQF
ncbi:hypothetical protein GOBAR_AA05881 [Gossypium barbadense]|uniref:Uncharacterized protein n=1 Tax=Gossypium barbadense TaxID=3634 RepID=A0A2P5YGJ7_GOSBA|nr:hypothetical protein GOBAR_AA05881 [Gossypium barbadense]